MFLQRSARLPMGRTSSSVLRSFLYLIGLAEDLLLKAGWSPAAIFDLAIIYCSLTHSGAEKWFL